MKLPLVLTVLAVGLVACSTGSQTTAAPEASEPPLAPVPITHPVLTGYDLQLCTVLGSNDRARIGTLIVGRLNHTEDGSAPFVEATRVTARSCPELADRLNPAYGQPTEDSADRQKDWVCKQHPDTEGC